MRGAIRAVSVAAVVTRAVQAQAQRGQIDKSDGSPVTIADFAAQAVLIRELSRVDPGLRVAGEESSGYLREPVHEGELRGALDAARRVWPGVSQEEFLATIDRGATRLEGEDCPESFWTIDPIDGTKGFIRGHQYSICVALIQRGRPVVAALGCPNLSEDFGRAFTDPDPRGVILAATGDGPTVGLSCAEPTAEAGPSGPLTRVERVDRMERGGPSGRALVFCESFEGSHSDQHATGRVIRLMEAQGRAIGPPARIDSQCKYAIVARGQADVFLRRSRDPARRDWIWDHAPGWLVAARAGVTVTDSYGREVDFARGRLLEANQGMLAAAGALHGEVLAELRKLT